MTRTLTSDPIRRTVYFQGADELEFYKSALANLTVIDDEWIVERYEGRSTYPRLIFGIAILRQIERLIQKNS